MALLENKKSPLEIRAELDKMVFAELVNLNSRHCFSETAKDVRFTVSESVRREVLSRLLKLNHERYEEEVKAGLHETGMKKKSDGQGKRKAKPKPMSTDGQMGLL